jgi:very-short-patch-repair endonuclease
MRVLVDAGFNKRTLLNTIHAYRDKYPARRRQIAGAALSMRQKGNTNGCRPPSTVLDRDELEKLVNKGYTGSDLCRHFGLSGFIIDRNLQLHSLKALWRSSGLPKSFAESQLAPLEVFCPGIIAAFHNYATDKAPFLRMVYKAYLKSLCQAWWIQDFFRIPIMLSLKKERPDCLDEIAWRCNRAEVYLAQELLERNIRHVREFSYEQKQGGKMADFAITGTNILIEVDGSGYHEAERDRLRDEKIVAIGFKVLRFTTRQVLEDVVSVMALIEAEMKKESSRSGLLVLGRSSISRSKAIIPT